MFIDVKRRHPEEHEEVRVHYNLSRKLFTVKARSGPHKNRVLIWTDCCALEMARMRVQQGGVDRIRETGVRDVVAYTIGRWVANPLRKAYLEGYEARINPKIDRHFMMREGDRWVPVLEAGAVRFYKAGNSGRMLVINPQVVIEEKARQDYGRGSSRDTDAQDSIQNAELEAV